MKEPYRDADRSTHLHHNGSNFTEWVASINRVLCVALNTELSVDDLPSSLENRSSQENRAISHFINATLPPDFALCIGVKLKVVKSIVGLLVENSAGQSKPNSAIILSLCKSFALFKKLGIDADELEGLLAQTACHPPPSLDCVAFDQLALLPFIYRVTNSQEHPPPHQRPRSPYFARPMRSSSKVRRPPDHLLERFGGACFHCGRTGHWQADCPVTKGFANPNPWPPSPGPYRSPRPGTPERRSQNLSSPQYQRERVSQVKFVERDASDCVLIDTGASIHLSGSARFATNLKNVAPFCIFFADSKSSVTISQTTTLKIPVKHGFILVEDVPFSTKILGTILSKNCWWVDVVPGEGTIVSAAETSSPRLFEMNPVSLPQSPTLSSREWHDRLGHTCDKVVLSFLKQHVLTFDTKSWQKFYCDVCAKSKSTHQLAKTGMDIAKDRPLDLLVLDIMGPFEGDTQGFRYLLIIRDHMLTYFIVYPLKLRSNAPAAIQETMKQLQVCTSTTPKALRTDNAEFTSAAFTHSLAKLGVAFYPSLPYSPRENGKAERLNRTLGDMARAMVTQSQMPTRFWKFAYASASFMHNRIPNSWCPKSSPHQVLFGPAPSITTLYPHGADTIVHIPAVHQQEKIALRAIECKLLKPLMTGGWLLWDPRANKMIQSASVIFPKFQSCGLPTMAGKGSLSHIVSAMTLGKVPTEQYFEDENRAVWYSIPFFFHQAQAHSTP
ncbi:hypothetical protein O181_057313 [Austropuccinia psidii MF-1]|uniref:Endonuclease n=1 Tax=Austropuccinia psidii MF-1 TaxID=1389203 RepID=A0A9Q3HUD3_9BASI|nr:hypothetical protein [Austropuccinia psidii MF-1]